MDRPEDQRRTLADIISWIANFTNKIKWVFTKDLKPRVLFGLKSDGTIVFISDMDGFPVFGNKPPELLYHGGLAWAGTAGSAETAFFAAKGYRMLVVLTTQNWPTNAPTTMTMQPNYSIDAGGTINFSDDNDESLLALTVGTGRDTFSIIYFSPDAFIGQGGFPIGEVAPYMRIQITNAGGTPTGDVACDVYGLR